MMNFQYYPFLFFFLMINHTPLFYLCEFDLFGFSFVIFVAIPNSLIINMLQPSMETKMGVNGDIFGSQWRQKWESMETFLGVNGDKNGSQWRHF
jgi:hypothetical protein